MSKEKASSRKGFTPFRWLSRMFFWPVQRADHSRRAIRQSYKTCSEAFFPESSGYGRRHCTAWNVSVRLYRLGHCAGGSDGDRQRDAAQQHGADAEPDEAARFHEGRRRGYLLPRYVYDRCGHRRTGLYVGKIFQYFQMICD